MGIITLRTTDEQDQAIEEVKSILKVSTLSKTLLHCVTNYQELLTNLEVVNAELDKNVARVHELEGLITNHVQSHQALKSAVPQTISIVPRTGKCATPTDHEQAQKNLLGLKEVFKVSS